MGKVVAGCLSALVLAACEPQPGSDRDAGMSHVDAASPDVFQADAAVQDAGTGPRPCPTRVDRLTFQALNQQRVLEPTSGPLLSAASDHPSVVEARVEAGQALVRALAPGSAQVTLEGPSVQTRVLVDVDLTAPPFATGVVGVEYGEGAGFGQADMPEVVLGPPQGAGTGAGSLHVVSLGKGGWIIVELGVDIADGPGADLLVFENPFADVSTGRVSFVEPGQVAVSAGGETFVPFPCDPVSPHQGCAGLAPVLANPGNGADPTDASAAGGDAFDLAAIGMARARFVRISDMGATPGGGTALGFDLDAVAAVNNLPRDPAGLVADTALTLAVGKRAEPRFDIVSGTSTTYGVAVQCTPEDAAIASAECGCTLTGLVEGTTSVRGRLGDLETTIELRVLPAP